MKAITLTQPWATLVALCKKKIETRSWNVSYRGPLAIHAAKTFPREARQLLDQEPFRSTFTQNGFDCWQKFPLGKVVAVCELAAVREILQVHIDRKTLGWKWIGLGSVEYEFELSDLEFAFGDYRPGRFAWLLHNIVRLSEPVLAKGALGLWEVNLHG